MKKSEKYDILSALSEEFIKAFEEYGITAKSITRFPERPQLPRLALSKNRCLNQPKLTTFFLTVPSIILFSIGTAMSLSVAGLIPGIALNCGAAILAGVATNNYFLMKNYALGPEKELVRIRKFLDTSINSKTEIEIEDKNYALQDVVFKKVSENKDLCKDLERLYESKSKANFFTRQIKKYRSTGKSSTDNASEKFTLEKFLKDSLDKIKEHSESQDTAPQSQDQNISLESKDINPPVIGKDRITAALIRRYGRKDIEAIMLEEQQNNSSINR